MISINGDKEKQEQNQKKQCGEEEEHAAWVDDNNMVFNGFVLLLVKLYDRGIKLDTSVGQF